jgi:hypothetical protein
MKTLVRLLLLLSLGWWFVAPVADAGNGGRNKHGMKISKKKSPPPKKSSSSSGSKSKYSGSSSGYSGTSYPRRSSSIEWGSVIVVVLFWIVLIGGSILGALPRHRGMMARFSARSDKPPGALRRRLREWWQSRAELRRERESQIGLRFLRDDIGEALSLEWQEEKPLFWAGYALRLSFDASLQSIVALVTAFPLRVRQLVIPFDQLTGLSIELARRSEYNAFLARLCLTYRGERGEIKEHMIVLIPQMDLVTEAEDFMFRVANILPKRASKDPFRERESLCWEWYLSAPEKIQLLQEELPGAQKVPWVEARANYE